MRKYYIDNIRILCILLLFPFHTAMIFNNYGENWYVHSKGSEAASLFLIAVYPWWMAILFAMAGMSAVYALNKRTAKEYLNERIHKLLIPTIAAILLLVPVQTYIANRSFNGYSGNYLEHLRFFFRLTDWSGYDGHFTTGQLWFTLYLYLYSYCFLSLMVWYKNRDKKLKGEKFTLIKLIPMFILIALVTPVLDIGGKSISEFAAYFLLGYFALSMEEVQERLKKYSALLAVFWVALIIWRCIMYQKGLGEGLLWEIEQRLLAWVGILAVLGNGRRYLEFNNKFTSYFTPAAFPLYIFHQTIIVITGYFTISRIDGFLTQYVIICLTSFGLTIAMYELCRRIRVTRFLFGIKK